MKRPQKSPGFALPVVLITCLALMIVLLSSMQTASSLRTAIDDQYYTRLANEAAQSGATYAVNCMQGNGNKQSWTRELTQSRNCTGNDLSPYVSDLTPTPNAVMTFSVGDVEGRSDGASIITSTGKVDRLVDGTSQVAKTYTAKVKRVSSMSANAFSRLSLGYYYYTDGSAPFSTGAYYMLISNDGKLKVAGANDYGQLGNGKRTSVRDPEIIAIPGNRTVEETYTNFLSLGWNAFFQTTDGKIYGMGWSERGQLGNNSTALYATTPQEFPLPGGENGVYVGSLGYATFVETDKGNIYSAGSCKNGQLGVGLYAPTNDCSTLQSTPKRVLLPTPDPADPNTIPERDIAADSNSAFVRMKGGRLYGWGLNDRGQLGSGNTNNTNMPVKIGNFGDPGKPQVRQMAFDGGSLYIIDSNNDAWVTGLNYKGELGIGLGTDYTTNITKVPTPATGGTFKQVFTDQWHVTFLMSTGDVWGAGLNNSGQLGDDTKTDRNTLVQLKLPDGVKGAYVYNSSIGVDPGDGYNNTYVISTDGKVYGTGGNQAGQLGVGTTTGVTRAVPMDVIDGVSVKAYRIKYAYGTAIIETTDGRYFSVGNNASGQLGDGTTNNATRPIEGKYLKSNAGSYLF